MLKCKSCGKEITPLEYEAHNKYCLDCYINGGKKPEEETNESPQNNIANLLKAFGIILAIVGIFGGFISIEYLGIYAVVVIVISIISATLIYGIGEIIQLLEDIKRK